jgi:hypothetical protein
MLHLLPDVHAVDKDSAGLHIKEAEQEAGNRGLAGTGTAHHGHRGAGPDPEADALQDGPVRLVAEADVAELNVGGAAAALLELNGMRCILNFNLENDKGNFQEFYILLPSWKSR